MPTMEASYGVVVGNRFGALTEDLEDDPLEQLKILEEAAKKKKVKQDQPKAVKETKAVAKADKEKNVKSAKGKVAKETSESSTLNAGNQVKTSSSKSQEQTPQTDDASNRKPTPRTDRVAARVPRESRNDGDKPPPRRAPLQRDADHTNADGHDRPDSNRGDGGFGRQGFNRNDENRNQSGGFGGPGRPGMRGRGGGRGGGGIARGGKRNFDRHSGSDKTALTREHGVKPVEKREGGGARNWGNVKDDIEEQLKEPEEPQNVSANAEDTENQDPNPEPVASEESEAAPAPPEPNIEEKQMTLDEWRAMQSKEVVTPMYDIRQPDEAQWKKGYYALPKKGQQNHVEEIENEEHRVKQVHKELLDIKIMFNEHPQRGGGRGTRRPMRGGPRGRGFGRGGERRGGGFGGFRDGGSNRESGGGFKESAPRVDDERDFPQLGTA